MPDNELQHFGVKGMRWGVRRSPTAHETRVADLKRRVKEADKAAWQKASDGLAKEEAALNAKLDALQRKKLSQIDKTPNPRAVKFIQKALVKKDIENERMDIIGRLEDKYHFLPWKERRERRKQGELDIENRFLVEEWTKRYNAEVKGKPFIEGIRAFQKIDREISEQMVEAFLENEIKNPRG